MSYFPTAPSYDPLAPARYDPTAPAYDPTAPSYDPRISYAGPKSKKVDPFEQDAVAAAVQTANGLSAIEDNGIWAGRLLCERALQELRHELYESERQFGHRVADQIVDSGSSIEVKRAHNRGILSAYRACLAEALALLPKD
jgi:hypothetical protein